MEFQYNPFHTRFCYEAITLLAKIVYSQMSSYNSLALLIIFTVAIAFLGADGKLKPNYYSEKCPQALSIVEAGVVAAIKNETRVGASLLRLHFHDCFVNVSSDFDLHFMCKLDMYLLGLS